MKHSILITVITTILIAVVVFFLASWVVDQATPKGFEHIDGRTYVDTQTGTLWLRTGPAPGVFTQIIGADGLPLLLERE